MADIEKIKIGNTHYDIRDAKALEQVTELPASAAYGKTVLYIGSQEFASRDLYSGCVYKYNEWNSGLATVKDYGPFTSITVPNFKFTDSAIANILGARFEDYIVTFECTNISIGQGVWKVSVGSCISSASSSLNGFGIIVSDESISVGDSFSLYMEATGGTEIGWKRISGRAEEYPIVENSLLASSLNPFSYTLSAYQGRVLKDMIDNISSVGRFLAMWDANTGTARNLSTGFTYQSGDYFIVSTVADSGSPNYAPSGSSYTGASTTVATDMLYLCDMYYYNGTAWQYLANHAKAIAIDEEIDPSSTNPAENRAIAAALSLKQNSIVAGSGINVDSITNEISVDETTIQHKLTAGQNITITNNVISSTGGGEGGSGLPCISTVDARQFNNEDAAYGHMMLTDFRGGFDEIMFTTNMDLNTLLEKKNDLYVGLYRSKRQKNKRIYYDDYSLYPGSQRKFVLQNDRRIKTNIRLRCWRELVDTAYSTEDPRAWRYFYVADDYESAESLEANDPGIALYINQSSLTSNFGTCLNAVTFKSDLCVTDILKEGTSNLERCEEKDIDTVAKKLFNDIGYWTIRCREAVKISDGSKHFIWTNDPTGELPESTALTNPVVGVIPDRFEDLVDGGLVSDYTLGKWRHDLSYLVFDTVNYNYDTIVNSIYDSTHSNVEYPTNYFWNVYWMDYPIQPIRLADCEVLVNIKPGEIPEEYAGDLGEFFKLKDIENKPYKNLFKQILFRYKYATDELWLRFSSWQKRVLYEYEQTELGITPSVKNNMLVATERDNFAFARRALGGKQSSNMSYHCSSATGKICERLQFNLVTCDDINYNLTSQSTPVKKRLASVTSRSFLID